MQSPSLEDWLLGVTCSVAGAFLVAGLIYGRLWHWRMGQGKWDPSKSWTSTLSVAGAILSSVLSASALLPTSTSYLSKEEYASLSLFFGSLPITAPLLYNFLRFRVKVKNDQDDYQGFTLVFVAASWLTLWAYAGQLVILAFLLLEMKPSVLLFIRVGLGTLLLLMFLLTCGYIWRSIQEAMATGDPNAALLQYGLVVSDNIKAPLPPWTLL